MSNVEFSNIELEAVHTDDRGSIFDLVDDPVAHIGFITFTKGAVRGNHYHLKSAQYSYVTEGEMTLFIKDPEGNITTYDLKPGTFTTIPAGYVHTYAAKTDAAMVDINTMSRKDDGYEEDTVRVDDISGLL